MPMWPGAVSTGLPGWVAMLKQRIATGVAAAAAFLAAVAWLPARHLSLISTLVLCFAAWEFAALCGLQRRAAKALYVLPIAVLALLAWSLLLGQQLPHAVLTGWFLLAFLLWLLLLAIVLRYPRDAALLQSATTRALLGVATMGFAGTGFSYLSVAPLGKFWIVYAIATVVIADVGAYFVGKALGSRKLAPEVSPGKSWEGFWGGFVAAQLLALLFYFWVLDVYLRMGAPPALPPQAAGQGAVPAAAVGTGQLSLALFCLSAALLSSFSVLGDLFESVLKRNAGVKDSGSLLPGHGGVLDRIDGLLPAVPLLALLVLLFNW